MTPSDHAEAQAYDDERLVEKRRAINVMTGGLSHRERLFGLLGDLTGKRVLELGCGPAKYTGRYSELGAALVVGTDVSAAQLRRGLAAVGGRERRGRVALVLSDAHALPFAAGSFDVVAGIAILHHLRLPDALGEVARVLRPTGRAAFTEPLAHNPLLRVFRALTPGARTSDEQPLSWRDLGTFPRYFGEARHEEFGFFSVPAAPLRYLTRLVGALDRGLVRACEAADRLAFRWMPFLRRYARVTLIELSGPKMED